MYPPRHLSITNKIYNGETQQLCNQVITVNMIRHICVMHPRYDRRQRTDHFLRILAKIHNLNSIMRKHQTN